MPWDPSKPPSQASRYGERCGRAFVHAANSVLESSGDEGRAIAAGHAAAQKCQEKSMNPSGDSIRLFNIYAPSLVASRSDDGVRRITGIASSTVRDRHGDRITPKALRKMAESAVGMTVFMNHKYDVPNDVFGSIEDARVVKTKEVDTQGLPIYDLKTTIRVADTNDRAVATHGLIEKDRVKLGLSIGAMLPEGGLGVTRSEDGAGRFEFDDLEMVELSTVSMPANARSWIDYAVKSVTGLFPDKVESGAEWTTIMKDLGFVDITKEVEAPEAEPEEPEEAPSDEEPAEEPESVEKAAEPSDEVLEEILASLEEPATFAGVTGVTTTVSTSNTTNSIDLDKTRVTVWDGDRTVEVDTGRRKPKEEEDPATQPEAETVDGSDIPSGNQKSLVEENEDLATVAAIVASTQDSTLDLLKAQNAQIVTLKAALVAEREERKAEKEAIAEFVKEIVERDRKLVESVGRLPAGRRAGFVDVENQMAELDAIYSEDVRRLMLRKGKP